MAKLTDWLKQLYAEVSKLEPLPDEGITVTEIHWSDYPCDGGEYSETKQIVRELDQRYSSGYTNVAYELTPPIKINEQGEEVQLPKRKYDYKD